MIRAMSCTFTQGTVFHHSYIFPNVPTFVASVEVSPINLIRSGLEIGWKSVEQVLARLNEQRG